MLVARRTLIRPDFRCFFFSLLSPPPSGESAGGNAGGNAEGNIARDERAFLFCSASFQSCIPWIMYIECIHLFIYVIEHTYCDTNAVLEFVRERRGISVCATPSKTTPASVSVMLISDWSREINVESSYLSYLSNFSTQCRLSVPATCKSVYSVRAYVHIRIPQKLRY